MSFARKSHPKPLGGRQLGCIQARLPPAEGAEAGVFCRVTYPADTSQKFDGVGPFQWFRSEPLWGLHTKDNGKLPYWLLNGVAGGVPHFDPCYLPAQDGPETGFPIVIMCHGLYGCCELYTQFCRELASAGAIVVALEHEDGTALHAVKGDTGERLYFIDEPGGGVLGGSTEEEFVQREVDFRGPFLKQRTQEIALSAKVIQQLARGEGKTSQDLHQKALQQVLSKGDPNRFILAAHSFGSTALVHFFHDPVASVLPFVGALITDVWWQPDANEMTAKFPVPFIQFFSEDWMTTKDVRKGAKGGLNLHETNSGPGENSLGVVWFKGSMHLWNSDLIYFFPHMVSRKAGLVGKGNPNDTFNATAKCLGAVLQAFAPEKEDNGNKRDRFEALMKDPKMEEGKIAVLYQKRAL